MTDNNLLWAETAVTNELSALANLPKQNINKPGSPFYVSLLKIASIVKGGYLQEYAALNGIKRACAALTWIPQKEIDYQWRRAYQRAEPRHPNEQNSLPTPIKQTRYQITEHDLVTGKTRVVCDIPPKTAVKAAELARLISTYAETGEVPKRRNLTVFPIDVAEKAIIGLQFPRYTIGLRRMVILTATHFLHGGLWEDHKNGRFDIVISLKNPAKFGDFYRPPYMGQYAE
jgi:hypothetical protein